MSGTATWFRPRKEYFLMFSNSRCFWIISYAAVQGFLPSAYRSLLASKYGAIFKVCTVTTLAVHVTSLIIFCWYGILAQREGMNLTRTLFSQHDSMSQTMTQLGKDADFIEGVVNGTIPVSGQLINGTFAPDPPSLLPHSQVRLLIFAAGIEQSYNPLSIPTYQTLKNVQPTGGCILKS
jgi:hypothetical protein